MGSNWQQCAWSHHLNHGFTSISLTFFLQTSLPEARKRPAEKLSVIRRNWSIFKHCCGEAQLACLTSRHKGCALNQAPGVPQGLPVWDAQGMEGQFSFAESCPQWLAGRCWQGSSLKKFSCFDKVKGGNQPPIRKQDTRLTTLPTPITSTSL